MAHCSWVGNEQHNPGEPLHWAREKSGDHHDCIVRHLMQAGEVDDDGVRHIVKAAWRACAAAELELEAAAGDNPRGLPVVYVAGPMRGYEQFNFPAFDTAAQVWADTGYHVLSPADMDRKRGVTIEQLQAMDAEQMQAFVGAAMREDTQAVHDADLIAVLPGWEASEGAGVEVRLALMLGKPIHDARTMERIEDERVRDLLTGQAAATTGDDLNG